MKFAKIIATIGILSVGLVGCGEKTIESPSNESELVYEATEGTTKDTENVSVDNAANDDNMEEGEVAVRNTLTKEYIQELFGWENVPVPIESDLDLDGEKEYFFCDGDRLAIFDINNGTFSYESPMKDKGNEHHVEYLFNDETGQYIFKKWTEDRLGYINYEAWDGDSFLLIGCDQRGYYEMYSIYDVTSVSPSRSAYGIVNHNEGYIVDPDWVEVDEDAFQEMFGGTYTYVQQEITWNDETDIGNEEETFEKEQFAKYSDTLGEYIRKMEAAIKTATDETKQKCSNKGDVHLCISQWRLNSDRNKVYMKIDAYDSNYDNVKIGPSNLYSTSVMEIRDVNSGEVCDVDLYASYDQQATKDEFNKVEEWLNENNFDYKTTVMTGGPVL